MKQNILIRFCLLFFMFLLQGKIVDGQTNLFPTTGSVGIGTITPNATALLEMISTSKGLLIPRMTLAERNAISNPATGLMIFQTNNNLGFYFFNGMSWIPVGTGVGANKTLSNLNILSINQALTPQASGLLDIGSSTLSWKDVYTMGNFFQNGQLFLHNNGTGNIFLGLNNGTFNIGIGNTFIGNSTGQQNINGSSNTFLGFESGLNNNASENVFLGVSTGKTNSTGTRNSFMGTGAGQANTTGFNNTFIGHNSGLQNTINSNNTYVGQSAGRNATGSTNSFFGSTSGFLTTSGNNNSFIGANAGQNNTTGFSNTYLGYSAGLSNTIANNNVVIGANSGSVNIPGDNNVLLGANLEHTAASLTNTIAIGFDADISTSNTIRIGNVSITKIGIGKNCASTNVMDFQATTARLTTGGVWTNASDRKLKDDFQPMDKADVLHKIAGLDIQRWHYLKDEKGITHIGPIAQEFYNAFKTGDDTTISTIDPSGVALLGIQQLIQINNQLSHDVKNLQQQIDALKKAIDYQQSGISSESSISNQHVSLSSSYTLEQNIPNPFKVNTTINCMLPVNNGIAYINFYNQIGVLLKSLKLTQHGKNTIMLTANEFAAGTYKYALIVDGKVVDSKTMVKQ